MTASAPTPPSRPDDTLGNGIESGFVLVIFAGCGFALDRWLGTSPWLTIGLFFLAAVAVFYRLKASYSARIDLLSADRRDAAARRSVP